MDEQLVGLQTLTAARRSKLQESIKLHQYIRDVDEVMSWLTEKQAIAESDDYGKDFEHLLVNIFVCVHIIILCMCVSLWVCVLSVCVCVCVYVHTTVAGFTEEV